ncbi:MAG: hypothetical protein R2774_07690 [Saprospiraceae bacterium]
MRNNFFVFSALLISILSCAKYEIAVTENIVGWTADVSAQLKDLYQIRLAFGKTVAAALKEKELREFIKQKSQIPEERTFHELVFSLIKDEVLPSGKTVMQVIREHEDSEVKELFGETLMDRVTNEDPMVAIKLPDVFHQYDWDTQKVIPFVGVETPSKIKVGQYNLCYVFYYYNGYHELIEDFESKHYENIKYFYLMVKYASDHIKINVNSMTNEKNITLEEFMPQIKLCKANILPDILKSGVKDAINPNTIYLNLKTCFDIWYDQCSYKGLFLYDKEPCLREDSFCPRDCVPDQPLKNNVVLTGFNVNKDIVLFQLGSLFVESFLFSYHYFKKSGDTSVLCRIAVPESTVNLFEDNLDVAIKLSPYSIKGATFMLPLVDLTYRNITANTRRWKDINLLITDNLKRGDYYSICGVLLVYKDIVYDLTICNRLECASSNDYCPPLSAEHLLSHHGRGYGYCTQGELFSNNFGIGMKF